MQRRSRFTNSSNMQTQMPHMYVQTWLFTAWKPITVPTPFQYAVDTLNVRNEMDPTKPLIVPFKCIKINHHKRRKRPPVLLSNPPSRLSEMDWSPSWVPLPRIIQFSRPIELDESDESDKSHSGSDSGSSKSDWELLDSTLTGTWRTLFFFWPP